MATIAVLLSSASAALATPTVSAQPSGNGGIATFNDSSPFTTDRLVVTYSPPTAGDPTATATYKFIDPGVNMNTGPGCSPKVVVPNLPDQTEVTCTVPQGKGVSINLGDAATPGAPQTVDLQSDWTGQVNTITGGPGADELTGSTGADTFVGGAGADDFDGGEGTAADTVDYSASTVAIHAQIDGKGDSGAGCPDSCERDTIRGTIENIIGGSGDDVLVGNASSNTLTGNAGNDTLIGNEGVDFLIGNAGDDTFIGGPGVDCFNFTTYSSTGPAANGCATTPSGATGGKDVADYSQDTWRTTGVTVQLQTGTVRSDIMGNGNPEDGMTGVHNVTGSPLRDELHGDDTTNVIKGSGGPDDLWGEDTDTTSSTVAGDDVSGGEGVDTFHYDDGKHNSGITVSLDDKPNDGLADIGGNPTGPTPEADNVRVDVENLTGGTGADTYVGDADANTFDGRNNAATKADTVSYAGTKTGVTVSTGDGAAAGAGPNGDKLFNIANLTGGDGDDTLIGNGALANTLDGGPGTDFLRGGDDGSPTTADNLVGGAGSDWADYSQDSRSKGVTVNLNSGVERSIDSGSTAVEDKLSGIENVLGTARDDTITGDLNPNQLYGGLGHDTINAKGGDDIVDPGTTPDGASDGAPDDISGDNGTDTVRYSDRKQSVTVTLDDTKDAKGKGNDGAPGEGDDVASSFENVVTGSGDDTIMADSSKNNLTIDNVFDGNAGDDKITGLGGNDTLFGNLGSDTVEGGDGNDALKLADGKAPDGTPYHDVGNCGAGNDTAEADQDLDTINGDCESVKRIVVPAGGSGSGGSGLGSGPGQGGGLGQGGGTGGNSIVTVDNPSVREGRKGTQKLVFAVRLDAPQAAQITVPFATANMTAKAGEDYVAQTGTLTFAPGTALQAITVIVKGDRKVEPDEQLSVALGTPTGPAQLGTAPTGIGTILNDDVPPRVLPKKLSAAVGPKRDKTAPYAFVVTGKLVRPNGVTALRACTGKVRVVAKVGKRTVARKTGLLDNTCHYTVPLSLGKHRGLARLVVRFSGNKALRPKTAKALKVRAG